MLRTIFILVPLAVCSCTTINPSVDIPDISLDGNITQVSETTSLGKDTVDSLADKINDAEDNYPDYSWKPIYNDVGTIEDIFYNNMVELKADLKSKNTLIEDTVVKFKEIDKDRTELQREIEELSRDQQRRTYGLMILAGGAAIGIGTLLTIFVSAKLGVSVGLAGIVWIALGRFFMEWAWVLDILVFVTLGLGLVYAFFKYRHMFVDLVTSVEDTVHTKHDDTIKEHIHSKSSKETIKHFEKIKASKKSK